MILLVIILVSIGVYHVLVKGMEEDFYKEIACQNLVISQQSKKIKLLEQQLKDERLK